MATSVPVEEVAYDYNKITRNDFPEGFVFGTATSAYQVEGAATTGGRGISIWDDFSMSIPGRISDGSNGNLAIDMYNRYKDDIRTMKSLGFDAYRFSISWPRIIPSGKISLGVNREGIDYYNDLINTLLSQGIKPFVTLFHWDLPDLLEKEYGGFLSGDIVKDYRDYVYVCFWEFGDRVKNWVTFNEPWTYCYNGYVSRAFPPGKKVTYKPVADSSSAKRTVLRRGSIDGSQKPLHDYKVHEYIPPPTLNVPITPVMRTVGISVMDIYDEPSFGRSATNSLIRAPKIISDQDKEPFIAAKNLIVAHGAAVELYHRKFKHQQEGEIGIVLNNHWVQGLTDKQKDKDAALKVHDFMFGWFLEPVLTGQYPETMRPYIPDEAKFTDDESKFLRENRIDFLGLNYYTARYAQDYPNADKDPKLYPFDKLQKAKVLTVDKNGIPIGPCPGASWLYIVPWGINKLLKRINEMYTCPPLYITENGVAEISHPWFTAATVVVDTIRVKYYRDHLGNVLDVINEWKYLTPEKKLEIKGFFAWALADNYEWVAGYTNRFGIIYIDYVNNLKRYPKQSAVWFSEFLAGKSPHLLPEDEDEEEEY